jgi:exopolysaccharide biosynthesis protein
MTRRISVLLLLVLAAATAHADWRNVAPGVDYQEFREANLDVHVARVDLTSDDIRVVVSRESEKGLRVSDFARKEHAIVAINGDYFDDKFTPVGLTVGICGEWDETKQSKREAYLALGDDRAKIAKQSEVPIGTHASEWMDAVVSGWPALVMNCDALSPKQLPGSDSFTRSPHPRTAVGLSKDRKTLYLVVADGRRTGVPGMTLAQLGKFMNERLGACSAMNLDGGGSAAMWVSDHIVNRPADGTERPVGNHVAVLLASDLDACDASAEADKIAANNARLKAKSVTVPMSSSTVVPPKTTTSTSTTTVAPPK